MGNEINTVVTIPLSEVHVDEKLNFRSFYDEKTLKGLQQSIKEEGLLQPMVVRPATREDKTDKGFVLTAGFRRMRCVKALKWERANFTVAETDAKGGAVKNLVENVNRDSLNSYELAHACKDLRDHFGMTGEEIAAKLKGGDVVEGKGKSKANVNNLIRLATKLHPQIVAIWGDNTAVGHDKCTTENLLKILKHDEEDNEPSLDLQMERWLDLTGQNAKVEGEEGEEIEGEEGEEGKEDKPKKPKSRPIMDILEAIRAVKKAMVAGDIEEAEGAAITMALEWAANKRATIRGLKKGHYTE